MTRERFPPPSGGPWPPRSPRSDRRRSLRPRAADRLQLTDEGGRGIDSGLAIGFGRDADVPVLHRLCRPVDDERGELEDLEPQDLVPPLTLLDDLNHDDADHPEGHGSG